ncbi:hypothetical protein LSM04_001935 [Trypanosoma melophagium]|uniref:uncharacterized protein n=1 Tax=Trypanosoma melophagium TaxID=715481 RepID=UPI00351A6A99|nr:hypothetical protein LSM04_001935 [Trypanosoma melophagium]
MKYFPVNIFIGLLALASIVVLPSFAHPTTHEMDNYSLEMYLAEFGKHHDDPEEYRKRGQIFSATLAEVKMLNKASHR